MPDHQSEGRGSTFFLVSILIAMAGVIPADEPKPLPPPAVLPPVTPGPISLTADRELAEAIRRLDNYPSTGRGFLEIDAAMKNWRPGVRVYAGHRFTRYADVGGFATWTPDEHELGARVRVRW